MYPDLGSPDDAEWSRVCWTLGQGGNFPDRHRTIIFYRGQQFPPPKKKFLLPHSSFSANFSSFDAVTPDGRPLELTEPHQGTSKEADSPARAKVRRRQAHRRCRSVGLYQGCSAEAARSGAFLDAAPRMDRKGGFSAIGCSLTAGCRGVPEPAGDR